MSDLLASRVSIKAILAAISALESDGAMSRRENGKEGSDAGGEGSIVEPQLLQLESRTSTLKGGHEGKKDSMTLASDCMILPHWAMVVLSGGCVDHRRQLFLG